MAEWVHPEHREIHELLRNWGRWAVSKPHYGHCGSVEHKYKSPQCWDERNPRPQEPDLAQAVQIEGLMRYLPATLRQLLVYRYVYHGDQSWCCRKLRLKYHRWEEYLYRARQMVCNFLDKQKSKAQDNENPSKTATADRAALSYGAAFALETD